MNAILDALAPLGVKDLQMPATPARVWQAIEWEGRAGQGAASLGPQVPDATTATDA
jgi:carbon-monoxide dehydrogenase large subunit